MAAPDPLDELIREVALRHGVALSREDPILIMHTVNARLLQDSQAAQQALLGEFKSELEEISTRWGADAKTKAERILNAALAASKDSMMQLMHDGAREITEGLRHEIAAAHSALQRPVAAAHRVALFNVLASALTVAAVTVLAVVVFLR
jgi:Transcriptional activator TraM.